MLVTTLLRSVGTWYHLSRLVLYKDRENNLKPRPTTLLPLPNPLVISTVLHLVICRYGGQLSDHALYPSVLSHVDQSSMSTSSQPATPLFNVPQWYQFSHTLLYRDGENEICLYLIIIPSSFSTAAAGSYMIYRRGAARAKVSSIHRLYINLYISARFMHNSGFSSYLYSLPIYIQQHLVELRGGQIQYVVYRRFIYRNI